MRHIRTLINTTTTMSTLPSSVMTQQQRSPWHSPVPYLFGGLAAMLGLIAFALLMLACSYWRLSGRSDGSTQGDLQSHHAHGHGNEEVANNMVHDDKIFVIMAGDQKPTFLATPVSGRDFSFADKISKVHETAEREKFENEDKMNGEAGNLDQTSAAAEDGETRQQNP